MDQALCLAPKVAGGDGAAAAKYQRLGVLPFDHERQLASVLVDSPDGEPLVVTKGAPEVVLDRCVDVPAGARPALEALFSEGARVVAVASRKAEGIDARGPMAADSLFHERARATYDAALCMYHDQALIPIKTLAFDHAVNVTLGLPFVRTSPDHGTAFDIAGTGAADPTSLVAALRLAARLAMADSLAALPAS